MIAVMSFTDVVVAEWGTRGATFVASVQLSLFWPVRQSTPRAFLFVGAVLLAAVGRPIRAQRYTRPDQAWTTFETPHFRVHAPRELAPWAHDVASRMESIRAAELRTVGRVPTTVTDVLVDDPVNSANGSAYPYLDAPAVFLWPVPPDPRTYIGNARSWGELLVVHEFAHIAHLTRPSRNPRQRLLRALLPGQLGPLATRTPRWVWEGYATYVEGVLTGSGRPHAPLRAAVLRRWALDGALPTYAGMSGTGGYLGGSFAYLMGSAYFEWLGATRGDSSVTALWRRTSARVDRSFDAAFAGVYGETPATLYNRFVADLTVAAAAERARLDSAGRVDGRIVQRLSRSTGDPALSPDGQRLVIELASADGPSRVVVWRAGADAARDTAADSSYARAQRRILKRDPEDVAAVRAFPLPRTPVATLLAVDGRSHHDPRWFADGRRVLLWRTERTRDDVLRPDLFVWDTRTGALRRVTRGAAVRDADPAPNGMTAAAVRCASGRCDLVRIDLATGAVETIVAGTFTRTWTRPRWSPDGRRLVAPVQDGGRWRLALVDAATGAYTLVTPDDGAERYDATFTGDGASLVYTSERGGVPNIVQRALGDSVERPITRVVGAAFAAAPTAAERSVYYLDLTPHGLDLRRVAPDSTPVRGGVVALGAPATLLPKTPESAVQRAIAARGPVAVDTFATGVVREHAYDAGPRHYVGLPFGSATADGFAAGLQLASVDPAGRLTWLLQGVASDPRPWGGVSLRAAWRGLPPTITGELFTASQTLSDRTRLAGYGPDDPAVAVRTRYTAAALFAGGERWLVAPFGGGRAPDVRVSGRVGAVAGQLRQGAIVESARDPSDGAPAPGSTGRRLAIAEGAVSAGSELGDHGAYVGASGQMTTGHTGASDWWRGQAGVTLGAYGRAYGVRLDGTYAAADRGAPIYERPTIGGAAPGLFDASVVSQHLVFPALPTAYRSGRIGSVTRVTITGAALAPYAAAVTAGDKLAGWTRVLGLEARTTTPFLPFARAPQSRLVAGVARIFDGPLRDRTRGYLSAVFAP